MKCIRTKATIFFLSVFLFLLPHPGLAQTPDGDVPKDQGITLGVQAQLDRLASEIEEKGYSYSVGYNPAMDFSLDQLCGLVEPDDWKKDAPVKKLGSLATLPSSFDWRTVGLPPVRNQGGCGSCWAFATVGVLESQIMLQSGTAEDLSEQYLVSCNESGYSCGGGWWAHDYHQWRIPTGESEAGAVMEADFAYHASDLPCSPPHGHPYQIIDWSYVAGYGSSVEDVKQAIYQYGPVGVGVAVGPAFQAYRGGVFDNDESAYGINHAVVLVGWDDAYSWDGNTYGVWILRNSWGSGWGEAGYMYITYGTSSVGYSANYVEYVQDPVDDLALVAPADAVTASTAPTFSWTGPFDAYFFYTLFHYDLGVWSGYYPAYFWMLNTSFTVPSNWWNKVDGAMPSYWAVCGYDDGWVCTDPRSFTKGVSAAPGD